MDKVRTQREVGELGEGGIVQRVMKIERGSDYTRVFLGCGHMILEDLDYVRREFEECTWCLGPA